MSMNDVYHPINCDDYDHLELACQRKLLLIITLKTTEIVEAKARDLVSRKNVEYLVIDSADTPREIRLDLIYSFSHPDIGTIIVSDE